MDELHSIHPGVIRMKALATSHVWCPGIDKMIEQKAASCRACQATRNAPALTWTTAPWERIHVGFAGPFMDRMFLVVTDTHSKWPEIVFMCTTTAKWIPQDITRRDTGNRWTDYNN